MSKPRSEIRSCPACGGSGKTYEQGPRGRNGGNVYGVRQVTCGTYGGRETVSA